MTDQPIASQNTENTEATKTEVSRSKPARPTVVFEMGFCLTGYGILIAIMYFEQTFIYLQRETTLLHLWNIAVYLLNSLLPVIVGIGLILMKPWAWKGAVYTLLVFIALNFLHLILSHLALTGSEEGIEGNVVFEYQIMQVMWIVRIVICGLLIISLCMKSVIKSFREFSEFRNLNKPNLHRKTPPGSG